MDEGTERRDPVAQTDDAAGVNGVSAKTSGETSDTSDTSDTSGTTESTRQPSKESTETLPPMARFARQQLPRLAPWAGAVLALVLIGMVAMLFADTRTIDAAVRPTPTATPAPTATAAPTMTPTAIDGFQFYRDPSNHYVIQYPLGWIVSTDNASQGIEFCDDCQNPGYIVQVNTPSNLGDVGPPPSQNSASGWVTYALNGLSSRLQSGTLTVLGEQQAITIGGVVWQSGGALVTDPSGSASFRVQVYATVYEGKPYILVLSTTEDRFTAGTIQFFGPMLQSFQFVKQPQP